MKCPNSNKFVCWFFISIWLKYYFQIDWMFASFGIECKRKTGIAIVHSAICTHRIACRWYGQRTFPILCDFVHSFSYFRISCIVYWYARYAHLYPLPSIRTACNSFCQVFHLIVVLLPLSFAVMVLFEGIKGPAKKTLMAQLYFGIGRSSSHASKLIRQTGKH